MACRACGAGPWLVSSDRPRMGQLQGIIGAKSMAGIGHDWVAKQSGPAGDTAARRILQNGRHDSGRREGF